METIRICEQCGKTMLCGFAAGKKRYCSSPCQYQKRKKMLIVRNEAGRFTKGNQSGRQFTSETSKGNQNAKGNPPNKTSFRAGVDSMENHRQWKGGVQVMKKDAVHIAVAPNVRVRRPLYVWEKVYGKLPKGYVIYHKDGDKHNDDINNLEAITRAELVKRNNKKIC